MKFFEDIIYQKNKSGHAQCGDYCLCEKTEERTVLILCDGIGSGVYANIAAITCANRLMELLRLGLSLRAAAETVAASMHRARSEEIPFAAFSAAEVLSDGQFTAYTYEGPETIFIQNGSASVLKPRFYTAGYEVIGEATGVLNYGDMLILSSDGVTQAGVGHGYGFGIGADGVTDFINRNFSVDDDPAALPESIVEMCCEICENRHEDDTSVAMIRCREAKQLTLLTGPPSKPSMDKKYVEAFMSAPGKKIICGSSTTDIVSRELKEKVTVKNINTSIGTPPEYHINGVDLTTEGAVMLNQAYNILGEPIDSFVEDSVAERLCLMLINADVITFMIGSAVNNAHENLLFKQIGVRVRKTVITQIAEKLRKMGKLVIEDYY